MSLWRCHREQSSAASLLSTGQDEEKNSGRRVRCHSEWPDEILERRRFISDRFVYEILSILTSETMSHLFWTTLGGKIVHILVLPQTVLPPAETHQLLPHLILCTEAQPTLVIRNSRYFTLNAVEWKYRGMCRAVPRLVSSLRVNSWLIGRVLVSTWRDRMYQQPWGTVSGLLKFTTWQTGGSRDNDKSCDHKVSINFAVMSNAVVNTFITPCSFWERLAFLIIRGRRKEFVNQRFTLSASLCFTCNRLNKSPSFCLQEANFHHHTQSVSYTHA